MSIRTSGVILVLALMGATGVSQAQTPAAPPSAPGALTTNGVGGKLQFATNAYDFGRVRSGEAPKYSYVFTNTGVETLEVRDVHACGCITLGAWTKRVEPGQTGVIPLTYNSAGFPSGAFFKTISVGSSDKAQPMCSLQLKGTIWREVDVTPQFVNFSIAAGAAGGSSVVVITNNTDQPLLLSEPQCNNPAFGAQLKTNQFGRGYVLVISRLPPLTPGVAQAQVTVKSSFTNLPLLIVTAWANVQAPITIIPAQITLGPAPLVAAQSVTVTIQNFSTNAVVLSEPAVTAKGVQVELKEVHPGHLFNAELTFPKGFEVSRGQQAEFSVKSSHLQYPVIKVPLFQLPPPSAPLPAPAPAATTR